MPFTFLTPAQCLPAVRVPFVSASVSPGSHLLSAVSLPANPPRSFLTSDSQTSPLIPWLWWECTCISSELKSPALFSLVSPGPDLSECPTGSQIHLGFLCALPGGGRPRTRSVLPSLLPRAVIPCSNAAGICPHFYSHRRFPCPHPYSLLPHLVFQNI